MTPEAANPAIEDVIKNIRARLEHAAAVARLAEACIDGGSPAQALTVVLDAEQSIHEVNTFLNAASLIHRCAHA
jgi:hypothetical protein